MAGTRKLGPLLIGRVVGWLDSGIKVREIENRLELMGVKIHPEAIRSIRKQYVDGPPKAKSIPCPICKAAKAKAGKPKRIKNLSDEQLEEIRAILGQPSPPTFIELGKMYGIHPETVSKISLRFGFTTHEGCPNKSINPELWNAWKDVPKGHSPTVGHVFRYKKAQPSLRLGNLMVSLSQKLHPNEEIEVEVVTGETERAAQSIATNESMDTSVNSSLAAAMAAAVAEAVGTEPPAQRELTDKEKALAALEKMRYIPWNERYTIDPTTGLPVKIVPASSCEVQYLTKD